MTSTTREIAAHIGVDPTCLVDWPGPGEVTRYPDEPMPEAERQRWERQRTEQHIAKLLTLASKS